VNDKNEDIARMILNYLHKNPDAGDTLEGISKWWVYFVKIENTVEVISEVLEELIGRGLVKKVTICNGMSVYKALDNLTDSACSK